MTLFTHTSLTQPQHGTPLPPSLLLALIISLIAVMPKGHASDSYSPVIETLQQVQKRAYIEASPQGQDNPLPMPETPVTVTITPLADEESRLEALAEEQVNAVSLASQQKQQIIRHSELRQFGYDIFNHAPTTFVPVEGIPVPENYRIGAGDTLIVQLYGKRNVEYKLVVTREGQILIPEFGPVQVAGLTFDEAEEIIVDGFSRRVIGAKAVVTMGKLRTIQIRITGDAVQPGIFKVAGLTTMIDAIFTSGGVRETGSLRNIQLIREGRVIRTLDLYQLLLNGNTTKDDFLRYNDTIFIPAIGDIVYVGGQVQRPAIYEIKNETTVDDIVRMAGGLLPNASIQHSHIERIVPNVGRTLIDLKRFTELHQNPMLTTIINGDMIRILENNNDLENVVQLTGNVKRPGNYQFRQGMRVSDLVGAIDNLLPSSDLNIALIVRENSSTSRTNILYAPLANAIQASGSEHDINLSPRDQLIIFNLTDNRANTLSSLVDMLEKQADVNQPAATFTVKGNTRYQGTFPLQNQATLLDAIALAGNENKGTDRHYGLISRKQHPSENIILLPFHLDAAKAAPTERNNPIIVAGDNIYLFDETSNRAPLLNDIADKLRQQEGLNSSPKLVKAMGEVMHASEYPLLDNMRASDLVCAAGGLKQKAFAVRAELTRIHHNKEGDNDAVHIPLNTEELLTLCNLQKAFAENGMTSLLAASHRERYLNNTTNPVLKPLDQLSFSEKEGWVEQAQVTLRGEVTHPGTYAIDRGETLCQVIKRAGGLTPYAYTFGAYFTRNSIRDMQQQTLDSLQDQLDDLMIDLSLSHSYNNNDKISSQWGGKQDYLKAIRDLEKAKVSGRMVVDVDKALERCNGRYDIALEAGDDLLIPVQPNYVQVAGQVYVPSSHLYEPKRTIKDYVALSGGNTVIGRLDDTYVIQANGEVLNLKGKSSRIARKSVAPGATIFVPLDVDRMNTTERTQSWLSSLTQSAILAGLIL